MEKTVLRLLIIDDSPDDAERIAGALRRYGYMLKQKRIWDLPGLQSSLKQGKWDAIAGEFSLPYLNAKTVLDTIASANLDLPFIVVTNTINDEDLVKIMRAGARDVILKNQLARIAPALEREHRGVEDRRGLNEARTRVTELESKSRAVVEGSHEALCYVQDGMHLDANQTYLSLFGYDNLDELTGVPVMDLIAKSDQTRFKEMLRKPPASKEKPQEFEAVKTDGTPLSIEVSAASIVLLGERCLQLTVSDVSRRKSVESRLEYMNRHDPLTGLLNRSHFVRLLEDTLKQAQSGGKTAWLLYVDLDQLKQINDHAGYAAGDRVLMQAARVFRDQFGDGVTVSRFGGDEFVVLLTGTSETEVNRHAETLKNSLMGLSYSDSGQTLHCGCQIAVVPINGKTTSTRQIIADALKATQATAPTPPPVMAPVSAPVAAPPEPPIIRMANTVAPPPKSAAPVNTGQWPQRLRHALDHNRFTLAYQPVVNLHGEAAEYFEVLLRLVADDETLITAGEFMPAAEHCGLGGILDRWATQNSIEALGVMHSDGRVTSLFVNIAPTAFHDVELLPSVIRWLRASGVKPEYLIFETDESMLLANPAAGRTFIMAAHRLGCRFALDNFGCNLSNTEYLRDLPISFLKIDGSLIRNLSTDTISQTALHAVVEIGHALKMKTVAKCVEKAENLAALWKYGIEYVQGYYFNTASDTQDENTAAEATLSSDEPAAPSWAKTGRRR